jgi:dTDP-3,4-didehydro-2,6-dideoxy-alpha-D-glucose 3-reductase
MINIGVLGGSSFAEKNMIPTILEMGDFFDLKGIASRSKAKAKALANKFGTTPFDAYRDILNFKELDAIYIPLPNALHFQWIEEALNNGLHVLVEKSLACSKEEVRHLTSLAKSKELALVENFHFRFHNQLFLLKN